MKSDVSVVGLGAMGTAFAGAFMNDGYSTTVWNRSATKVDEPVAKGALRADTVTDAVSASPLVVVCVLNSSAVHDILDSVCDTFSGRVLANLTTGTPDEARRMAEWAAGRSARYLAGGIMAIPSMIAQSGGLHGHVRG